MKKYENSINKIYGLLKLIPRGYHRKQKNGCIVLVEDILDERIGRIKLELNKLHELVERATPKKVNGDTDDWACPKCDSDRGIIDGRGHCAVCGQALDWSE